MIELVEVHEPEPEEKECVFSDYEIKEGITSGAWDIEDFRNFRKNGLITNRQLQLAADTDKKLRQTNMIDTDFEKQKQQGKRGLSMFERVTREHEHIGTDGKGYDFYRNCRGSYSYKAKQAIPPLPEKPHWFERFLRWWYSI